MPLTSTQTRPKTSTLDANEAVARIAYQTNDVVAIYPITPSSAMGEWADQWRSNGDRNLWGALPDVVEMESEIGAAGAVHGSLSAGRLTTTFTASQGLLLMLPNMFKIAGELTPFAMHVAARSVATHALSIFGDHSDVMAARTTGFALLSSNSVQEAMDFALIAQAATLEARVPFLHFFDGFRTSHEVAKIRDIDPAVVREMIDDALVDAHHARGMSPENPTLRGTAQNPDVFFQAREACNPYYQACPAIVQAAMDKFGALTGRRYRLFDYAGPRNATRVIVIMGSGGEVAEEAAEHLNRSGEKVGVLKVRLYRPFDTAAFLDALPPTTRTIAVLDRTKEPGATGEPLYLDVCAAVGEAMASGSAPFEKTPRVIGGRYGLSSKEFTPAMVKAVFDEAAADRPRNHFTVGIEDDVTHLSLPVDRDFSTASANATRAIFFGLGSDGTVGAAKNTLKILGDHTDNHVQGYFVYDSKKSGSVTASHLRFGPDPIRSSYLIRRANFVGCHQFQFVDALDVLDSVSPGGAFLLNSHYPADTVWDELPGPVQDRIIRRKLRFYVIDAYAVAKELKLGRRINTIMQACFFKISGILPLDEAVEAIKDSIRKTYGKRGKTIVDRNCSAVDAALEQVFQVETPDVVTSTRGLDAHAPAEAPEFVRTTLGAIMAGKGDDLPVSALPCDGVFPTGTTKYEKRRIAQEIPDWDPGVCIQCGKCVAACPHGVIRGKLYEASALDDMPKGFKTTPALWPEYKGWWYTLQVSPDDCTGCALCVEVCPAKNKSNASRKAINMQEIDLSRDREARNWDFFLGIDEFPRDKVNTRRVKDVQLLEPLFEFSGACAGCGETPYVKLLSQLFGDRAVIANATGCSSIYGGNLPTTPWTKNRDGRGPAWSNSLFEDNAQYGMGMRVAIDQATAEAAENLRALADHLGPEGIESILANPQVTEAEITSQRDRVAHLRKALATIDDPRARRAEKLLEYLVRRSLWIVGGDGWAYDIGYGGLDHVMASGRNVNILVLDTEVYSNTGGQSSKSTPRGAVAKFAAGGKASAKKDLGLMAVSYGNVYVARVAMGANDAHTIRAFLEAESYPGPSLILAYSHCIAHGYDLRHGFNQQKLAMETGYWPLYRFDPRLAGGNESPFQLDSRPPKKPLRDCLYNETRYAMLAGTNPEGAAELLAEAQEDVNRQWSIYEKLATAMKPQMEPESE